MNSVLLRTWPWRAPVALGRIGQFLRPAATTASGRVEAPRRDVVEVAFVTGLIGAFLGMATGWQVNIESAQVVAGVVQYPIDNPFAMYHLKTWTLLHQVPAALLACGVPERVLALLVGGLAGMISFQALALCALAAGANRLLAATAPLLLLGCKIYGELSSIYPVRVLSDAPWVLYGCFGTSLAVLVWALLGVGSRRLGLFLMGASPAIHPTLGAWCLAVGGLALVWTWLQERGALVPNVRRAVPWLLAGLSITVASLLVHLYLSRNVPSIAPELKAAYIDTFTANWDSHRKAFPLDHIVVLVTAFGVVTCGAWLRLFAEALPAGSQFLLRAIFLSATLGIGLCLTTQWQEQLPTALLMAMPGRYINVAVLALPALWLGMLYRNRPTLVGHCLLAGLVAFFVVRLQVFYVGWVYVPSVLPLLLGCLLSLLAHVRPLAIAQRQATQPWLLHLFHYLAPLCLAALAARYALDDPLHGGVLWAMFAATLLGRRWSTTNGWSWAGAACEVALGAWLLIGLACILESTLAFTVFSLGLATLGLCRHPEPIDFCLRRLRLADRRPALLGGLVATSVLAAVGVFSWRGVEADRELLNWENNPVFAAAWRGRGFLLASANVRAAQLRTRRPVLLEGPALNQLPYVPESGPAMNRILQRVYGEDLFAPRPPNWHRGGGLPRHSSFTLWRERPRSEWQELAQEFGFTQIITTDNWHLDLPVVARFNKMLLYEVPTLDVAALPLTSPPHRVASRDPYEHPAEVD